MKKIERMKRNANARAHSLGHILSRFKNESPTYAYATCLRCGLHIVVTTRSEHPIGYVHLTKCE